MCKNTLSHPLSSFSAIAVALCLMQSCSDYSTEFTPPSLSERLINLSGQILQENQTRANDYGFVTGDRMGIYIVDRIGGQSGNIDAQDNRAANVLFNYDGDSYRWSSPTPVYWRDQQTPIDIYGYYPGVNYIETPSAYSFTVETDQTLPAHDGELATYEQSDLLWGRADNVQPTADRIVIRYSHILAGIRVHLIKGEGFTDTEWQKLEKILLVNNTVTTSTVNLSTGTVATTGTATVPIRMAAQSDEAYRAVVIPQTVAAQSPLITLTLDGQTYIHSLASAMTYEGGKLHNFTLTVNKREATGDYETHLTADGITPWENDAVSHQFQANAYVVVHNDKAGSLAENIRKAGYDNASLQNLKVTGTMNSNDFIYIRDKMPAIKHLNLRDVNVVHAISNSEDTEIEYGVGDFRRFEREYSHHVYRDNVLPDYAFRDCSSLQSVILPTSITRIGHRAFFPNSLWLSTLEVPEGVTSIGILSFADYFDRENGVTLILPSTLQRIENGAFSGCGFECELNLSDDVTYIGERAFEDCHHFYGTFHLPSKLTSLSGRMFSGLGDTWKETQKYAFNGSLELPQGITDIPGNAFSINFKERISLFIPQGVRTIGDYAFSNMKFSSLSLPDGLEYIGDGAFTPKTLCIYAQRREQCLPCPIQLPSTLKTIGNACFFGCGIEGELTIPAQVPVIGEKAFSTNFLTKVMCTGQLEEIGSEAFADNNELTHVVLPRYLDVIGNRAFSGCGSLRSIVCLAPEPPTLGSDVWQDVEMDKVVVEVPEDAVELYRNADGWRTFRNITAHHELAFDLPAMKVLNKGGAFQGIIRAEGEWQVTECPQWCHVSPAQGSGKTEVTVTIAQQPSGASSRQARITFRLADKDYSTYTDVYQYAYQYDEDESIVLQRASAGSQHSIPLFIVGDGFDAEEVASGHYLDLMREQMEHFFSIEPFKSYREYFTVSTSIAVSPQGGIGNAEIGKKNNRFGTYFNPGTGQLEGNEDDLIRYTASHGADISDSRLPQTTILLLCNEMQPLANTTLKDNGLSISYIDLSDDVAPYDQRGFVLHEACGRGFGKLAPEYLRHYTFIQSCTCSKCNDLPYYQFAKSQGWYENVTLSSSMNDAPWSHLIFHPRYASIVDMYEGGFRHARGVYRSEAESVMSTYTPYFNTISRESIVKRIMEYAGETYSFEKFVEKDIIDIP